ncbi:MAG: DUF4215 domain-containing protein, partial [Thermoanaerobaculia bacterium]|nr:DUF4215 domain-containing protein [Thermoanaerobaculia bacterium]
MPRRSAARLLAPLAALALAAPAHAAFHFAVMSEVLTAYGGDAGVQFVEIEMLSAGQIVTGNSVLAVFDSSGSFVDDWVVPGNVANGGAGVTWLMASAGFEATAGFAPDFVFDVSLPTAGGMVCWGAPGVVPPDPATWDHTDPENFVDCLAYGTYGGPGNSLIGTPTSLEGDGHALLRVADTHQNLSDWLCGDPATPANNTGGSASLAATTPCPLPVCGDGVVSAGEECDDGNTAAGDGCDASCLLECGNGVLDPGEECDDGNQVACDGCGSMCFPEECGNGIVEPECGEACDDGNTVDGDGCDATCSLVPCAPISKAQAGCANEVNKRFAGVGKAGGKLVATCLKGLAGGKLTGTLAECSAADARGKVAKAHAKTLSGEQKKCEPVELPTFGYTDGATANAAGDQWIADILEPVFGSAPVADKKLEKDAAKCQLEVAKSLAKYADTVAKVFVKDKKAGFAGKRVPQLCSAGELASVAAAAFASEKAQKVAGQIAAKIGKKCPAGDLSAWFGTGVDATSEAALATSARERAACSLCLAVTQADWLSA